MTPVPWWRLAVRDPWLRSCLRGRRKSGRSTTTRPGRSSWRGPRQVWRHLRPYLKKLRSPTTSSMLLVPSTVHCLREPRPCLLMHSKAQPCIRRRCPCGRTPPPRPIRRRHRRSKSVSPHTLSTPFCLPRRSRRCMRTVRASLSRRAPEVSWVPSPNG